MVLAETLENAFATATISEQMTSLCALNVVIQNVPNAMDRELASVNQENVPILAMHLVAETVHVTIPTSVQTSLLHALDVMTKHARHVQL